MNNAKIRPLILTALAEGHVERPRATRPAVILPFPGRFVEAAEPVMEPVAAAPAAAAPGRLSLGTRMALMMAGACSGLVLSWMCTLL